MVHPHDHTLDYHLEEELKVGKRRSIAKTDVSARDKTNQLLVRDADLPLANTTFETAVVTENVTTLEETTSNT